MSRIVSKAKEAEQAARAPHDRGKRIDHARREEARTAIEEGVEETMTDDVLRYRLRGHVTRLDAQLGHELLAAREQLRLADALAELADWHADAGEMSLDDARDLGAAVAAYRAARGAR